jgi:hypothetical protein
MQMPVLSNPKHERFAQLLVQGESAVNAYEQAGYRRDDGNAVRLTKKPAIADRVQELTGRAAARVVAKQQITKEKLVEWHNNVRKRGMKSGQLSAADTAIKEISILTGHRIEKSEIGAPGEFDALTDDELERALIEMIQELGLFQKVETQLLALGDGGVAAVEDDETQH